jgi:hypothetical protein
MASSGKMDEDPSNDPHHSVHPVSEKAPGENAYPSDEIAILHDVEEQLTASDLLLEENNNNNNNNKRSHEDLDEEEGLFLSSSPDIEDVQEAKRQKTGVSTSKKVNQEQWDFMFNRLLKFREEHGHCLVPKRYAKDQKLGTWVETQRVQYKRLEREVDEQSGGEVVQPSKRLNQARLAKL